MVSACTASSNILLDECKDKDECAPEDTNKRVTLEMKMMTNPPASSHPSSTCCADHNHNNTLGSASKQQHDAALTCERDSVVEQLLRRQRICEESRRDLNRAHPFWDTQPVPKFTHGTAGNNEQARPLEPSKPLEQVRDTPYPLPTQYEWCCCDLLNDDQALEIYNLLRANYVEDDDNMFRFDYSVDLLRWALTPPHFRKDWHVGVRVAGASKKLVAFITGIPASIRVQDKDLEAAEINFLCVHKKLRAKRLAPVLIKEITRRVNLTNRWQAVYTAGVTLPRPVASCRYYHRSLNPRKLYEVSFSHMGPNMTMSRALKLYRLPEEPPLEGIRPAEQKDVPAIARLLGEYLNKFQLRPVLSEEEVAHWMLPKKNILFSYVRERNNEVTEFLSFYSLPSTVIGNSKHPTLSASLDLFGLHHTHTQQCVQAAYSFYVVPTECSLRELLFTSLILAKKEGFDVFNALDVMNNLTEMKELKFGVGDGYLQYYLYNYFCPSVSSSSRWFILHACIIVAGIPPNRSGAALVSGA